MEEKKWQEYLGELLKEKQQICEQLEVEMVQLRDELKSKRVQEKFENNSTILDNILKSQRNSSSKAGLGYEQKGINGFPSIIKNHPKSYAEALLEKSLKKEERTSIKQSSMQPSLSLKKEQDSNRRKVSKASITPQNKSLHNRYPYIFHGYCFACSNFGHKSMMCKAYGRNRYRNNMFNSRNNQTKTKNMGRNYNNFSPLQDSNIECYNCHHYGHKESNCRLLEVSKGLKLIREQKKQWKRKTSEEECLIALKVQDEEDLWYVDSGCSKHMIGNKDKFESLKKRKGKVTFGDNASGNILGKGTVSLGKDKS